MNKLLTKNILAGAVIATFGAIAAFATPLPALFYASSFSGNVGDTFTFDLKVSPDASKPAYTVGATLKYDPTVLKFVEASVDKAWLTLSRSPYEITDTTGGVITRTAGYPEGLKNVAPFTHYTFKAIAKGDTKVVISEGMALDADNNDSGLQAKSIAIKIGGENPAPAVADTGTPAAPAAKKNAQQTITLDVTGATAAYTSADYNFAVMHTLKVAQPTTGTTTVAVFDQNGSQVYTDAKTFDTSTNTSLAYVIPAGTLQPGDYSMVFTTIHSDQKTTVNLKKDLGVLAKETNTVETQVPTPYIPLYVYGIFAILALVIFLMVLHKRSKKFRNFLKNF